uniref:GREB1-like protein isoform X2 n=1 Tax=Myxine glutinosa TaxID=7769 RepID=UPI00358DEE59
MRMECSAKDCSSAGTTTKHGSTPAARPTPAAQLVLPACASRKHPPSVRSFRHAVPQQHAALSLRPVSSGLDRSSGLVQASSTGGYHGNAEVYRQRSIIKPNASFAQAGMLARPSAIAHYASYNPTSTIRINGNGGSHALPGSSSGGLVGRTGHSGGPQPLPPSPTNGTIVPGENVPLPTSGPPKKRHRGWSPSSPPAAGTSALGPHSHGQLSNRTEGVMAVPALHPAVPAPLPSTLTIPPGESVVIPDRLTDNCRTRPVILIGHGTLPYLYGNVGDIVVSPVLMSCFSAPQYSSKVLDQLGLTPGASPSLETLMLLTVHYLAQLAPDRAPMREELDQALLQLHRLASSSTSDSTGAPPPFLSQLAAVAPSQLPWLARLAACPAGGALRVLVTPCSLGEGLAETLQTLARGQVAGEAPPPRYVVVICASCSRGSEFCVLVTGPLQARALSEGMLTTADSMKEIGYELITGKAGVLTAYFQSALPDVDLDALLDRCRQERNGFVLSPFPERTARWIREEEAAALLPVGSPAISAEEFHLFPAQLAAARKLLSQVCAVADSGSQNLDLGRFGRVDFLVLVPPSEVLLQQTLRRLRLSGVLADLGLEERGSGSTRSERYVACLDGDGPARLEAFLRRVRQHPYTLFVLIHDHAHSDLSSAVCGPGLHGEAHLGLADRLVNCREARESPNLLVLQVSCCPYGLQTQNARISPYNEVYWPSDSSTEVSLPDSLVYFGLANYLKVIQPGCRPPPLRYDDAYESMADSLLERFPRLHSEVIRAYLLIRQYTATLAWLAARRKPTKAKATDAPTAETLQVLAGLVHHGDPSGYGHMLLLRLPSVQLARVAFERLRHARDSLGLQFCFEVLLTTPTSAGFTLAPHFLQRLRVWRGIDKSDWLPKTFQDLEGLPCILLLSGTSPMGETFPRSLQFCDLRLLTMGSLTRSGLEQELGVTFRYVSRQNASTPCHRPQDSHVEQSTRSREVHQGSPQSSMGLTSTENSASPASSDDSIPKSSGGSSDGKAADSEGSSPAECSPATTTTSPVLSTDAKRNGHLSSGIHVEPKELDASGISGQSPHTTDPYTSDQKPSPILPACIIVPKAAYSVLRSGSPPLYLLLPAATNVGWATHLRPPPAEDATPQQASTYYRQWSVARQQHCDHDNRPAEGVSGCFHPRRLLLSGPPQIGKTGAYLQFLRVLNRMLIRLQEVDIYDEGDLECGLAEDSCLVPQSGKRWPDLEAFSKLTFDPRPMNSKYRDASPLYTPVKASRVAGWLAGVPEESGAGQMSKRRTVSVMLSRFAVHNTFHHCEICHAYMEPALGVPASALYTFSLSRCLLGEDIQLHILVPPSQERYFMFTPQGRQVDSLRLPVITDPVGEVLRSPVFTPTTGRHEQGLLNLFHALEGSPVPHLLVVHERELPAYQRYWPNHCILALPRELDHSGIGAARLLVQELCRQNLERERARHRALGARNQDVWPFVVLLDDSCVMFYETDSNAGTSADLRNVSLKRVLLRLEEMPNITRFAMCGVRRWSGCQASRSRGNLSFSRCHLHDLVLLNADVTRTISYDQHRFSCEDVDFNLRASAEGLLLCRFNSFSVMKKQILVGGQSDFPIQAKLSVAAPVGPTSPAQFVCQPDSEYTFLSAPPHFLLERYLRHRGPKLYPLAAQCPDNPVLAVDCYLDLGPQVTICTMSSRPDAVRPAGGAVTFSGLLLYLCDSSVTPGFLRVFKFLQGATLCLVCQDRSSLRQAVVRLELEEEWQCRLRDEFQTANCPEERPLFFLTGRRA